MNSNKSTCKQRALLFPLRLDDVHVTGRKGGEQEEQPALLLIDRKLLELHFAVGLRTVPLDTTVSTVFAVLQCTTGRSIARI